MMGDLFVLGFPRRWVNSGRGSVLVALVCEADCEVLQDNAPSSNCTRFLSVVHPFQFLVGWNLVYFELLHQKYQGTLFFIRHDKVLHEYLPSGILKHLGDVVCLKLN